MLVHFFSLEVADLLYLVQYERLFTLVRGQIIVPFQNTDSVVVGEFFSRIITYSH